MLRYDKDGKIELIYPAQQLSEVKELHKKYSPEDINKIYIYTYNVYCYDSIYSEFFLEQRKERVCVDLFDNKVEKEFFENPVITAFIDKYIDMTLTSVERDHQRCIKDIEDLHFHISSIPFVIKKIVKKSIFVKDKKTGHDVEQFVDMEVEIDNSEEKIKAISVREKLYQIDQRLRKIVETKKIESEITAKTLFE